MIAVQVVVEGVRVRVKMKEWKRRSRSRTKSKPGGRCLMFV